MRLIFSAAASVPLLLLGMIPALQFDNWQWLSMQLATPILMWAGWPFHRAAWTNLRHGAATMDTLISIGTISAWSWSVVSLFFLGAGEPGMHHTLTLVPERGGPTGQVYFEIVGVVITLLLAGRTFEARAKRRAGDALRSLIALGAKDAAVLAPTAGSGGCRSTSCAPAIASSCARARRSRPTARSSRARPPSTARC